MKNKNNFLKAKNIVSEKSYGTKKADEKNTMNRRAFLRLSGFLGLGLAAGAGGMFLTMKDSVRFNKTLHKVSMTRLAMGTFVSMTLIHDSVDKAQKAMELAFDEISRLTGILSRFDKTSAVSELNNKGILKNPPPELLSVVKSSLTHYRISKGNFDITVKPVVDFFKKDFSEGQNHVPDDAEIDRLLACVGSDNIAISKNMIRFKKPHMGITLDGIAKGFIVDRVSDLLKSHNIKNHLINAGGDIKAVGHQAHGKAWTIAVQDPKEEGHYPDFIRLYNGAVTTSGNYEVYFDKEKVFNHIINPGTGFSPAWSTSASVTAPTVMDADALSTALMVMGPEQGIGMIESLPRCESLSISRQGKKFRSPGWKGVIS